ncbi:MAG: histidine phosphatase family protein [Holophagaceae bacterium]|nr:histidine phosphatase family protein [Holophagaceae bacterium]
MTTLLLIRHGIAEDYRPGHLDSERALTPEGWRKTRAAMAGLVALGHRPSRGISSPYRRALETMACLKEAALAADARNAFPVGVWDGLTPDGEPEDAEAWLRQLMTGAGEDEVLAFTSHEPFLSSLIARLTGRRIDVKKASCTVVAWVEGGWRFERHCTPSELRGE